MAESRDPDRQLRVRLRQARPRPSREFSLGLQNQLLDRAATIRRPPHLRMLVLIYLCCGIILLAFALAGALGSGPLA